MYSMTYSRLLWTITHEKSLCVSADLIAMARSRWCRMSQDAQLAHSMLQSSCISLT